MERTPQQAAFREAVKSTTSSIVLVAAAGSGKTTCLLDAIDVTKGTVAIVAFNKSIATELQDKLKEAGYDWKKAQAGTVHSFGFKAYRKMVNPVEVDDKKVHKLVDNYFEFNKDELPEEMKGMVVKLVSFAKQSAIGLAGSPISNDSLWYNLINHYDINDSDNIDDKTLIDHARVILQKSNNVLGIVDFDDMIYMPLLKNARFWTFDVVMVDEAQDINAARRALVRRMVSKGGRVIAVGDPRQAIYGFTGADSDSLDLIKKDFNANEMPLSVCFRCGSDIVKFSQTWNPDIQAFEGKGAGLVTSLKYKDFMKLDLDKNSVMLCRNNKPLVETAFALLREGKAVYVEGRDIGKGLENLARRWKVNSIDTLIDRLDTYREREKNKAITKGNESKAQFIEDQVDTLMVIINRCLSLGQNTVQDVSVMIDSIFKDTKEGERNCFTLSSIHKSKGREWSKVYWLDRVGTIPSKWARKEWQIQQENNLAYVAATRAEEELIEVVYEE